MNLLLDTQAFLWFINGDTRLSEEARELIEDVDNPLFLSKASLWEMAIKISIGKLELAEPFGKLIPAQLTLHDIIILPIEIEHINEVIALPLHHRDPFDRLIIAQAIVQKLPLVGADSQFDKYQISRLW
jgi:PIN domain nuclease of toxin-antitoxin system